MNILFISNLFPPHFLGGYEILCNQVRELLQKKGHKIQVLTSNHVNPGVIEQSPDPEVYRTLRLYCPFSEKAGINRVARLKTSFFNHKVAKKLIKKLEPDVVFVWSQLRLTPGAAKAAQELGIPCAYTFNDDHISGYLPAAFKFSPRGMTAYVLDRTFFRFTTIANLNLSCSTSISELIKSKILKSGVAIANSKVIYQGIPLENFPRRKIPPKIPTRNPEILYAGQLHHYKGVHTLIEAVNRLAQEDFSSVNLKIAGDGPQDYKNELAALAKKGNANITFLGRLPPQELPNLYRSHDVFVFPSIWQEPFGLTHLEAMASGTPVISTNDGGHGEFLSHESNALVFPKEDSEALFNALKRLLNDNGLAKQLADKARNMVESRFSLERYVDDLDKFLTDASHRGE